MSSVSPPPLTTPPSSGPNVSFIRSCLHRQLRVSLSDGRVVEGTLECFDDSGNMILSCTTDVSAKVKRRRGVFEHQTFRMGTVLVPGHHQVSILLKQSQNLDAGFAADPLNRMGELGKTLSAEPSQPTEAHEEGGSEGDGE